MDSNSSDRVEISKDTLEIMNQEGSECLNRIHSVNDAIQSKNLALLGFILAVISIVPALIFSEGRIFSQTKENWLLIIFFSFSVCSIMISLIVIRPKDYSVVIPYSDGVFWTNMEAEPMQLNWDLIKSKKKSIEYCLSIHEKDAAYFRSALILFIISIAALLAFVISNAEM